MTDDVFDTVPVQYDPWDTSPPVPSAKPSGGLGIPPADINAQSTDDLGKPWSSGYKPIDRLLGAGGEERYQTWPERMMRSGVTLPHDVMTGEQPVTDPDTGHTADSLIDRASDMAGTVALGTAPAPAAARGSAGVFLGPMGKRMLELQRGEPLPEHPAAVANMKYGEPSIKDQGMREAQAAGSLKMRDAAGLPTQGVFEQSGMFLGADGIPRREVPDLGARLVPAVDEQGNHLFNKHGLEFRYQHPAGDLHAAYDLPNITVGTNHPDVGVGSASFDPATRQIVIGANPYTQSGLKLANQLVNHEVQHGIQHAEGFTSGGNPLNSPLFKEYYAPGNKTLDIPENMAKEKILDLIGAAPSKNASDVYKALQGEVEARNVQTRRGQGYNYLKHPELTEDLPRDQQIVPYNQNSRPSTDYLRSMLSKGEDADKPINLGEVRQERQLNAFHKEFTDDIRTRAAERSKVAQQYHEDGRLPFPVGSRFTTEHSLRQGLLPFEVKGHFVDRQNPEKYGYYVERGQPGASDHEQGMVYASNPSNPSIEELAKQFQLLGGIKRVKTAGGRITNT